jgi:hypothetical protein
MNNAHAGMQLSIKTFAVVMDNLPVRLRYGCKWEVDASTFSSFYIMAPI